MKRGVLWALAITLALYIITQTSFMSDACLLLFMGYVPGTNLQIPSAAMLVIYPLVGVAALYWLSRQPMFIGSRKHNEAVARNAARKEVAKATQKTAVHNSLVDSRRRYRPVNVA